MSCSVVKLNSGLALRIAKNSVNTLLAYSMSLAIACAFVFAEIGAISPHFAWLSCAGGKPTFQLLVSLLKSTKLNQSPES